MAITIANAKIYVARVLGNSSYSDELTAAGEAIDAAIQEWNLRHDWKYLLMDTRNGFTVLDCDTSGLSATVTTGTTNGFAGVSVGQTVAGTGVPANTTVSSINSTASIVLSTPVTLTDVTLTFTGEIPIIAGTSVYNLPSPFKRPYSARLMTDNRILVWRDWRHLDRTFGDISGQTVPVFYTAYNPDSFSTNRVNGRVEVFPVPSSSDVMRMRFFRPIAAIGSDSDNLDVLDRYIYALLEMARFYYLKNRDSESGRTELVGRKSEQMLTKAIRDDRSASEDRDVRMVPFIEWGYQRQVDSDDIVLVDW